MSKPITTAEFLQILSQLLKDCATQETGGGGHWNTALQTALIL